MGSVVTSPPPLPNTLRAVAHFSRKMVLAILAEEMCDCSQRVMDDVIADNGHHLGHNGHLEEAENPAVTPFGDPYGTSVPWLVDALQNIANEGTAHSVCVNWLTKKSWRKSVKNVALLWRSRRRRAQLTRLLRLTVYRTF